MNTTPEQLRIAADIIEKDVPWDSKLREATDWLPMALSYKDPVSMLLRGYEIRPRPLSFPPIPEGCSLHNPDNLTPEQVGDGWRLLTVDEMSKELIQVGTTCFAWCEDRWSIGNFYSGNSPIITYRVPISTPFPCGSKIVDGKLVKPWVPKFSAGQKVKVIASTYDPVKETKERIGKEATVIEDTKVSVDLRFSDNARWSFAQADLEPHPEPKKRVPLGPSDIRPGNVFRYKNMREGLWAAPSEVGHDGLLFWSYKEDGTEGESYHVSWEKLMSYECSNDGINWTPCFRKE